MRSDKYKVSLIILYDSEKRFLLQHRTKDARLLPNHWAFFGGGLKKGETPEEAVKREAFEELGYATKAPLLVLEKDFTEKDVKGYLYIYIEAFYGNKSDLKLQEGQNWGWYKESEVGKLKMLERDKDTINFISRFLKKEATKCAA